jgi:Malate/L-lactate dehydrogenase
MPTRTRRKAVNKFDKIMLPRSSSTTAPFTRQLRLGILCKKSLVSTLHPGIVSSSNDGICNLSPIAGISTVVNNIVHETASKINSNNKQCCCKRNTTIAVAVKQCCPRTGEPICRCLLHNNSTTNAVPDSDKNRHTTTTTTTTVQSSTVSLTSVVTRCPRTGEAICRCKENLTDTLQLSPSVSSTGRCLRTGENVCRCADIKFSSKLAEPSTTQPVFFTKSIESINREALQIPGLSNNGKRCPITGELICLCSRESKLAKASSSLSSKFTTTKQSLKFVSNLNTLSSASTLTQHSCRFMTTETAAAAAPPGFVNVSIEHAYETTKKALQRIGWDENDASVQSEIMVAAELCGNNQGLVKMYQPQLMSPAPNCSKPVIERDSINSAIVNGNQSPGMLAAITASNLVVSKLQSNPELAISIVSTYNTSTSSGQLAHYVERIAQQGYIGIAVCNSPEFVSPIQGAKPVFGTNPFAIGIPLANSPYPFTVRCFLTV